jgi:hypothetical protein
MNMYKNYLNFNTLKNFYSLPKKHFAIAQNIIDYRSKDNPRVFFTVAKNGTNLGNLTFEVYNIYYSIVIC